MKKRLKNIIANGLLIAFSLFFFTACEKSDSEKEWGIAQIYMPQASIQSGGLNNNYVVPYGTNEFDKNYTIDSSGGKNDINVILGVYRSGLQALEAYSVNIVTRPDTVDQLIDNGVIQNAVRLPDNMYSIPSSISVSDGQREATFYLTIDRNKLLADPDTFGGKTLVLAVGISDPSRYDLNISLSTTIVIVKNWETIQ
jgi:hypothetical protein